MSTQSEYVRASRLKREKTAHYIRDRYYRRRMWVLTLLSDLAGFAQAVLYVHLTHMLLLRQLALWIDDQDLIILSVCLILFATSRLYPGVGLNPATEMKLVTQYLATCGLVGVAAIILLQYSWQEHIQALLLIIITATITVLFSRWSLRWLAGQLGLWDEPVVLIRVPDSLKPMQISIHFSDPLLYYFKCAKVCAARVIEPQRGPFNLRLQAFVPHC